ncbi:uncharacterized protein LOC123886049 [Trifolium pratense]|uniref:uncharacterized protein LOC123886049 n=1 Tax=Trifolium pratense TaxID=57577 RepID=UPI001E69154F|nr:uncharacterized protein LOC123886049 [Trifolium pratense]
MKIISWNIRGLGGPEKRKEVRQMVGELKPFILCIQETKLQNCDTFLSSTLWGSSSHGFSYRPSAGASRGLLTLWDSSEVEVWSTESREHVLWCHGRFSKTGEEFYMANVYAPCDDGAKQGLWESLSARLLLLAGKRVCVCGDFNAVKHIDERRSVRGGNRSSDHIPFNQFIEDNMLIDLPLIGRKFTWFKGDGHSMSRLDRFLLSEEWCLNWPNCKQMAKMRGLSDHCPLVLSANEEHWGPSPSRMLKCWKDIPGYKLFEGDANSKYFHSVLASRRRRNSLAVIQVDGVTVEGVNPIRQAVFSHFESHFQAPIVDRPGIDDLQFKRLNLVEIGGLTKPFSETEVKQAVWDCDSYKSPGPDGINFSFIKDFWVELRGDVMRFISDFHRNGRLTKGINSTFIALIPKTDSPQRLSDFRPISLVGSLYKILAKVLANRLRQVIGSVISESQIAFVKNRQILDGILIANEVVDEARKSKKDLLLFKVDFEKAYDSVDWGYLDAVMGRMAFPSLWRKWIRECVCTATASVLVNGSPTDEFPLRRGLRQGDPLSPFLFLLAAEGLNVLMEAMVARNLFTGYSISGQGSVSVSHLQFADDTLLMGIKSWANVRALRAVLVLFETMSGLKVNFNKSMLVGVNISESLLCEAASTLCCKVGKIPFLYMGLQIGGDPRRLVFWEPMLTRLKNRLSGWKSRFLSFGGRLEYGGLGVRQLREFNIALLGKWCWRMLVDREGLWFRVLVARYGLEGGSLRAGGQRGSVWWRELVRIREGVGEPGGSWFSEHVSRRVGDGSDTLFWTDPWLDGISLRERFGRLFELADQVIDRWHWRLDPDSGYTVGGVYQLLTSQESVTLEDADKLIWHSQVPLKVSIFAWRLLRDRLPTRANLVSRGVLSPTAATCVFGCGAAESAHHLFLSCSIAGSLWDLVRAWIGISLVDSTSLRDHFVQFTASSVVRTRGTDDRIRHNRGRAESRQHQGEPEHDEPLPAVVEQQVVQQGWPGGPIDTSLLTRYEQHVARYVWFGQECVVGDKIELRIASLGRKVVERVLDHHPEIIQGWLNISGLCWLERISLKLTNPQLLSAFVERWHPEKHCHFTCRSAK